MTKEELSAKIAELEKEIAEQEAALNEHVAAFNKAVADNSARNQAKAEEKLSEIKKVLNKDNREVTLLKIMFETDDKTERLKKIAEKLTYSTKYAKVSDDKDTKRKLAKVEVKNNVLDVSVSNQELGADPCWYASIEKLGYLLTLRVAKGLGIAPENAAEDYSKYKMSEAAKEFNLPATGNDDLYTVSNNKLTDALKEVIGRMLGESYKGKVLNHDAFFLITSFTREGKVPLSVRTKKSNKLSQSLLMICHKVLTDDKYTIEIGQEIKTK